MSDTKYEPAKGPWLIIHARGHHDNLDKQIWLFKVHRLYPTLAKATQAAIELSAKRGVKYAVYECAGYVKAKPLLTCKERKAERKKLALADASKKPDG